MGATNVYFVLVYQKSSISYRLGVGPWFSAVDWIGIVCLKGRTDGALFNLGDRGWYASVCAKGDLARGGGSRRAADWLGSALIMWDRGLEFHSIVILVIFFPEGSLVCPGDGPCLPGVR